MSQNFSLPNTSIITETQPTPHVPYPNSPLSPIALVNSNSSSSHSSHSFSHVDSNDDANDNNDCLSHGNTNDHLNHDDTTITTDSETPTHPSIIASTHAIATTIPGIATTTPGIATTTPGIATTTTGIATTTTGIATAMPTLTPNATATIPATVSVPEGLWHWNPQSTADRYPAFRVIECTPQTGTEGDTIHIRLTGTSLDQLIPRLRMAFGLCVVPVRLSLSNLSDFVNLTAIVPQWQMCQTPGIKALVHVIVLQYTNDQVIEHVESSLFATYFHYGHRSLPMDYVAYDENNNQRLPIPNGELSGYDMSEYAGYYDTNRSPQYSSQSSSRPQDYYEDPTINPTSMMGYSYRQPIATQSMATPVSFSYAGNPSQYSHMRVQNTAVPLVEHVAQSFVSCPPQPVMVYSSAAYPHMPPQLGVSQQTMTSSIPPQPFLFQPSTSQLVTTQPMTIHPATISEESGREPTLNSETAGQGSQLPPSAGHRTRALSVQLVPIQPASIQPTRPQLIVPEEHNEIKHYREPFLLNRPDFHFEEDAQANSIEWMKNEMREGRLIARFWRKSGPNTVSSKYHFLFDWNETCKGTISISCIYWEMQDEFVYTSVDCIRLIEYLVDGQFTQQEKNRVRRNLEEFQPLTLKKHCKDTEEFFVKVMKFFDPKPRNIEKDIKLFKWNTLGKALQKIIGQYTASYSSTTRLMYMRDDMTSNFE